MRRATEEVARRNVLQDKRTNLAHQRVRIHSVIDTLDNTQKQQLRRLLIEGVRVTG